MNTIQNELSNFNPSEILISKELRNEDVIKKALKVIFFILIINFKGISYYRKRRIEKSKERNFKIFQ